MKIPSSDYIWMKEGGDSVVVQGTDGLNAFVKCVVTTWQEGKNLYINAPCEFLRPIITKDELLKRKVIK